MMRWNGFGRSVAFAAVAGAGVLVALPLAAPVFGAPASLRLYLLGIAVLYVSGLAAERRRGLAAGAVASALALPVLLLPLGAACSAVAAAAIVAIVRSAVVFRSRPLRACVSEAMLLATGLSLAEVLADGTTVGAALAIWGYFLVQSTFFLIGGARLRRADGPVDPFDRARAELLALLR
jgi:hypothetical protein